MMKKHKGEYGSRNQGRNIRLGITLLLAAAIIAQLVARRFTDDTAAKNILTVMAILTVLPMANMASPLLASWNYRTPDAAFYEKIRPYEAKTRILYDLVLTTKEQVIAADAAIVHPIGVFLYVPQAKLDGAKAEKGLNALFSANRLDANVKIIRDEKSFLRRLDIIKPADQYEDDGSVSCAAELLKNLSM